MALLETHRQVLRNHLVISTRVAVPKLLFLYSRFWCRDVGPNGTDDKHDLEKQLWHLGSTTSTVASLRVARLGWLPSQAKRPLHWHWTSKLCHCSWNIKWDTGRYLQLHSFTFFALHDVYSVAVPKLWFLRSWLFLLMWAQMGQITNTAWKNTSGTLPVQLQQWHPCEWQD